MLQVRRPRFIFNTPPEDAAPWFRNDRGTLPVADESKIAQKSSLSACGIGSTSWLK
jgi:hypothetical protein